MSFDRGNFHIELKGPMASGKTVLINKLIPWLEENGYEVRQIDASERGFEHTISVRWVK